jgi:hypothetical protein
MIQNDTDIFSLNLLLLYITNLNINRASNDPSIFQDKEQKRYAILSFKLEHSLD